MYLNAISSSLQFLNSSTQYLSSFASITLFARTFLQAWSYLGSPSRYSSTASNCADRTVSFIFFSSAMRSPPFLCFIITQAKMLACKGIFVLCFNKNEQAKPKASAFQYFFEILVHFYYSTYHEIYQVFSSSFSSIAFVSSFIFCTHSA